MNESASEAAAVIAGSKQVASNRPEDWVWVDRSIWTERMLAALGNGVSPTASIEPPDDRVNRATQRFAEGSNVCGF